ncbi:MAG: hypothetical protein AVDCRST_MAG93-119 [uncultured Chloroflexia bacterium]|uniref:Uncharacterized protein n=1 Tax=uncultured Chloroflexia bacterium TaxID=1672391 RepID=A0A6J4H4L4_9CHLR|nr:MAG: hypothetical protein AVDCRST_MAG93-119 [uncultured Chloroflexia bacterium]
MNQERYTEIRHWVIKGLITGVVLLFGALIFSATVAFLNVFGVLGLIVIIPLIVVAIRRGRRGKTSRQQRRSSFEEERNRRVG